MNFKIIDYAIQGENMINIEKIRSNGVIPVVEINEIEKAVPVAKAILAGGLDVMEVTCRNEAAFAAIKAITESVPEMMVGAGRILTADEAKSAAENGAAFVSMPGYDEKVVDWCTDHDTTVIPGCVTPSEVMNGVKKGVSLFKFFALEVYGGIDAMKMLSQMFETVSFIPVLDCCGDSIGRYISAPFVSAIAGCWNPVMDAAAQGRYDEITEFCSKVRDEALGYEFFHMGVNAPDRDGSLALGETFEDVFGFSLTPTRISHFSSDKIEIMSGNGRGEHGHIGVATNNINMAMADLIKKGYTINMSSAAILNGRIKLVYINEPMGGFAIHLTQR